MATNDSMIQVKDLKKHYKMGTIRALDGVTVNINKGDVIAVIGPSGSGKSTFLRSLNLLEEPTGGAIIFSGVDITKKKYRDENGKTVKLRGRVSDPAFRRTEAASGHCACIGNGAGGDAL